MSIRCLNDLTDHDRVAELLEQAGLGSRACQDKTDYFSRLAGAMIHGGIQEDSPAFAFFVPGRIEVLGKHTDYAGGRSLLAAPERGFSVVTTPRDDNTVRIACPTSEISASFAFEASLSPTVGHWSNYPMTAARRLALNFPGKQKGADIAFVSDLPVAAGMSSSSALIVATFLALAAVNEIEQEELFRENIKSLEDLAGYLGCVENGQSFGPLAGDRGVGTFGGSEDHVAMLCSVAGRLRQYSYCPVRYERSIVYPKRYTFAIACSGVAAEKTGDALEDYNRLSRMVAEILAHWNRSTGREESSLAAALSSSPGATEELGRILAQAPSQPFFPEELSRRLEHFIAESKEIIPSLPDELHCEGTDVFGQLVARSQALGARLLDNQTPETVFLAATALECGAAAASAFGAGFGGSVWAMIPREGATTFLARWRGPYVDEFPHAAAASDFFTTRPGPGAIRLGQASVLEKTS